MFTAGFAMFAAGFGLAQLTKPKSASAASCGLLMVLGLAQVIVAAIAYSWRNFP